MKSAGGGSPWAWIILLGCLLVIGIGLLLPRRREAKETQKAATSSLAVPAASTSSKQSRTRRQSLNSGPSLSAEEVVASKISLFAKKRRAVAREMAKRFGIEMPADLERFFDLAEAGNWDELNAFYTSLKEKRENHQASEALTRLWAPMMETYGVEQVAHAWPAQKLLDYGEAILSSLRPGMVYVGGTDPGRFIPTLLNETGEGDPHVVLTQNALADNTYLEYTRFLYGDKMKMLADEDSQQGFQDYIADATKRLNHDQQFPDEPKQLRPGEDIRTQDSRIQVSGQVAVMGINEKLLQALMEKNPDLSFALEESFPLKSTYASAAPLGPIMELRAADEQQALTSQTASQTVDYWRSTAETLLAEGDAADSDVRKAYAKMASAQASLFADHSLAAQAEQAYQTATQIYPSLPETVFSYVGLLLDQKRFADAIQVAQNATNADPKNQQFLALLQQLKQRGN